MPGIDGGVTEHLLDVDLMKKPVQQRQGVFALEQNKAV